MTELLKMYQTTYDHSLKPIASALQMYVSEILEDMEHIDRVSARAKTPTSFVDKAAKKEDGKLKYDDPLSEIQDQIGARVIVYYKQDVDIVQKRILNFFRHIEMNNRIPNSDFEFAYFGRHFILLLPSDLKGLAKDASLVPPFFELQIKTLFQHAWSEAEHDLGYKQHNRPLSADQKRRLAFSSAQAWGADRVFEELNAEINYPLCSV